MHPSTRDAQEILARWSSSGLFDPFGPLSSMTKRDPAGDRGASIKTQSSRDADPTAPDSDSDADSTHSPLRQTETDAAAPAEASREPDTADVPLPELGQLVERERADRELAQAAAESVASKPPASTFRLDGPHRRKSRSTPAAEIESTDDIEGRAGTERAAEPPEGLEQSEGDGKNAAGASQDAASDPALASTDGPGGDGPGGEVSAGADALRRRSAASQRAAAAEQPHSRAPSGSGKRSAANPPTAGPQRRVTQARHATVRGPHFEVREQIRSRQTQQTNWVAVVSQFLSYCGVAGLTIGTACVIWGYFGGIASYLPVGWVVLTFGQMLLFLGMITLVSTGIENSSAEMTRQLDALRDRLNAMERNRESDGHSNAA